MLQLETTYKNVFIALLFFVSRKNGLPYLVLKVVNLIYNEYVVAMKYLHVVGLIRPPMGCKLQE